MLSDFYASIDAILIRHIELVKKLQLLRDLVKESLASTHFQCACIEAILDNFSGNVLEDTWQLPDLFYHSQLDYSVRFIFWPAFYDNQPHQHKTWSITGVFNHALNVNVYDKLDDAARLKKTRTIATTKGAAGYLLPGCIHNISNPLPVVSSSIHIFNHLTKQGKTQENVIRFPVFRQHNMAPGSFERTSLACLEYLKNIKTPTSYRLILRFYEQPSPLVKWMALKTLSEWKEKKAETCLEPLKLI